MVRHLPQWRCVLLVALIATGQAAAAGGSLTAAVDRKELYQNEHVVLTLSLVNSDTRLRAEGVSPNIDLTVLADQFELGVPRTDFRFNLAREERRATSELTVELFPRRSGRLTIPAFGVDGLSTTPIALQVLPLAADARPEVFARSGLSRNNVRVGEQVLLYLDLYYRTRLKKAEFGAALETEPLQIEVHALPNAERSEQVGGLDYNVTRSAWAASPQTAAPVVFHLPALWIETRAGKQWRLPAQEQRLGVQALPAGLPPGVLAAPPVLTQSVFRPATVGHIVPWQITVRGAVGLNTLPEQLPFAPQQENFKLYFDPPERRLEILPDGGVDSIAVYSGYLMPLAAGTFTAPALELPYVDTGREQVGAAALPGQMLEVAAGAPAPAAEPAAPAAATPAAAPAQPTGPDESSALTVWQAATAVFSLAWLVTLFLWWRRPVARRPRRRHTATAVTASPGQVLKERLLAALGNAHTLEQGLRGWEHGHGTDEEVRAAVRAVQRLCYHPGMPADEAAAQASVARALAGLSRREIPADTPPDPWAPQAFHPTASASAGRTD